jgi:hypothetical protein
MSCIGCADKLEPRQKIARALQEMSGEVPQQVPDPQRQQRLQDAITGLDGDLGSFESALEGMRSELRAVNARPDATRAEIERVLDDFDAKRKTIRERVLQHHFAMIAATTDDEWHQLSHYERDALSAASLRQP